MYSAIVIFATKMVKNDQKRSQMVPKELEIMFCFSGLKIIGDVYKAVTVCYGED